MVTKSFANSNIEIEEIQGLRDFEIMEKGQNNPPASKVFELLNSLIPQFLDLFRASNLGFFDCLPAR